MSKIITEDCGNVAILRLSNRVTNAIDPNMVNDINESLREIRTKFKGIVLAGGEKFFSIGLDLPALLKLDRTAMTDFWYKFNQLALTFLQFRCQPSVPYQDIQLQAALFLL